MKALFCGLGSIGQRHLRNLRALHGDSIEVLAFRARGGGPVLNADMTVRAGADLESAYNLHSFSRLEDALAEKPDVAFITNPNALHLPVALECARAGCHLFIEKPVSHSMEGVQELEEVVERNRLAVFVAYQFRFHPGLQFIKSLIDGGRLGNLTYAHIVNAEYLPDWHPWEDYRETHPARRELGGGCLAIQTHELDYALWLFGMPATVYAAGGHLSSLKVNVEDTVDVLMRCVSGGRPFPVHIHLDYLQRPPQRVCEVVGDLGKVRYDFYAEQTEFIDHRTQVAEVVRFGAFDRNRMFLEELRHFFACVKGEERPLIDLEEGLRSMRVGEAAARSLELGQVVSLS